MKIGKKLLILLFLLPLTINAQEFILDENDTTVMTEYNDGRLWAYRQHGDFVVGMTDYVERDDYGKYYQILVFVKNLGETSVTFDPSQLTSILYDKYNESVGMKVYTYEQYMKKVKEQQALALVCLGLSAGMNAGAAGLQTTYTTSYMPSGIPYTQVHTTYNYAAASAANIAATTQMMTLSRMMSDDKKTISQGYLKITTIHPDEGLLGYMNIKYKRGQQMTVNIPIDNHVFSFNWDISKKKKK